MPFLSDLVVSDVDATCWRLIEPLEYQGAWEPFTVPVYFITDFATIPRLVSWLLPRYGAYTRAAILHDYLCEEAHAGRFSRKDADGIFRRSMREMDVPLLRRYMMWAAVRAAGRMSDASLRDWLLWVPVSIVSLLFIAIPALIVQAWLIVFWLLEGVVWLCRQVRGRTRDGFPEVRSTALRSD